MKLRLLPAALVTAPLAFAQPTLAAPGDPVALSDTISLDPLLDARLRWENVDTPAKGADAVTMRLRSGWNCAMRPRIFPCWRKWKARCRS
jgi:hypothetical protein